MSAAGPDLKPIVSWLASKECPYSCPECKQEVILKKGRIKVPHFAHRPESNCQYGIGESQLHMITKKNIYEYLANNGAVNVEMEKKLIYNRPDIYFETEGGCRVAIEVQISTLTLEEIERRTALYWEQEIHVLWISPLEELLKQKDRHGQVRLKAWQRFIKGIYYGCIFYWDNYQGVMPVRFDPVTTTCNNYGCGRTLKTIKIIKWPNPYKKYDLLKDFSAIERLPYHTIPRANIYTLNSGIIGGIK